MHSQPSDTSSTDISAKLVARLRQRRPEEIIKIGGIDITSQQAIDAMAAKTPLGQQIVAYFEIVARAPVNDRPDETTALFAPRFSL